MNKIKYIKPDCDQVKTTLFGSILGVDDFGGKYSGQGAEGDGWANENNMFEPESDEPFWDLWDNGNDKKEEDE